MRHLPYELLIIIFSNLNHRDLIFGASRVCKFWRRWSNSNLVWRGLYQRAWGPLPTLSVSKSPPKRVSGSRIGSIIKAHVVIKPIKPTFKSCFKAKLLQSTNLSRPHQQETLSGFGQKHFHDVAGRSPLVDIGQNTRQNGSDAGLSLSYSRGSKFSSVAPMFALGSIPAPSEALSRLLQCEIRYVNSLREKYFTPNV
jgi:hypothetical protein